MTNNLTFNDETDLHNEKISSIDEILQVGDENPQKNEKSTNPIPDVSGDEEEFEDPAQTITKHTLVTSPWTRLGVIGITFGLGFLVVFLFLNGVFNNNSNVQKENKVNTALANDNQEPSPNGKDGDVYAQLALNKQEDELSSLNKRQIRQHEETGTQNKDNQTKLINKTPPNTRPPERTINRSRRIEVPYSQSRISVPQNPPPPRSFFNAQIQRPKTIQTQALDPIAELNRLRNLGSFGNIVYASADITNSESPSDTDADTQTQESESQQTTEESLFTTEDEDTVKQNNSIEKITPRWSSPKSISKVANNYLPQENQILQGRRTQYLVVGQFASGVLVTPLVKQQSNTRANQDDGKRYVAKLTQDLYDNYGEVAIPSGTLLALEFLSVDGASYAQVEVRSIIKDNTEYPIKSGAISVLGNGGNPLIARQFKNKSREIAQYDLTVGLVSALGKVGEVINQPDTEEEFSDDFEGRTRRRTSGNRRNIPGALLEGGFGKLSQIIGSRAQTSTQEILNRPNVWFLPQNTKVTFLVNRTLEL